jgi:hypothetical protein
VILLVIEGVYMVARDRRLAARAIMVGLLALPLAEAFAHVGRSRADQDVKDALTFVDAHYRSGDTLVVSHDAQYAAGYYALCDCLNFHRLSLKAVAGTVEAKSPALASTSGVIVQQLTPLPRLHGRLWLLDASETPDTDVRSMISSPVTLVYRAAGVAVFTTRR